MYTKLFTIVLSFSSTMLFAQTYQLPADQQKKLTKPQTTTQVREVITPAELSVPNIELVSATKNDQEKSSIVRVKITIRNTGKTDAVATTLKPLVANSNSWKSAGETVKFPAVKAGQSVTKEFTFKIPYAVIAPMNFKFKVNTDAGNIVKESNESNNSSVGILIGL